MCQNKFNCLLLNKIVGYFNSLYYTISIICWGCKMLQDKSELFIKLDLKAKEMDVKKAKNYWAEIHNEIMAMKKDAI